MGTSILGLPQDVLINVLLNLDLSSLLAGAETCKTLYGLLKSISILRLRKERLSYGLSAIPTTATRRSPAEDLILLQKSETAWQSLHFRSRLFAAAGIDGDPDSIANQLTIHGIVKRVILHEEFAYALVVPLHFAINPADFDFHSITDITPAHNNASDPPPRPRFVRIGLETGDVDEAWLVPNMALDSEILDFALDGAHDVLVWLEARALPGADFLGERRTVWLHSYSLSAALPFPSTTSTSSNPLLVALTKNYTETVVSLSVAGSWASMVITPNLFVPEDGGAYGVLIVNWSSGARRDVLPCGDAVNRLRGMTMLSGGGIGEAGMGPALLTLWRDTLEVITFKPGHASRLDLAVGLELPPLYHWAERHVYLTSSSPTPVSSNGDDGESDPDALITLLLIGVDANITDWKTYLLAFSPPGLLSLLSSPSSIIPGIPAGVTGLPTGTMLPWSVWSMLPTLQARLVPLSSSSGGGGLQEVIRSYGRKVFSLTAREDDGCTMRLREFGRYAVATAARSRGLLEAGPKTAPTSSAILKASTSVSNSFLFPAQPDAKAYPYLSVSRDLPPTSESSESSAISTFPGANPDTARKIGPSLTLSSHDRTAVRPVQEVGEGDGVLTLLSWGITSETREFEMGERCFVQYARCPGRIGYSDIKVFSTV